MLETSLIWLCVMLFLDGATLSVATTPLLLRYGQLHRPLEVALLGGLASALGSAVQLLILRWALSSRHRWLARLAPSRARVERALTSHPSASFVALVVARATPLPDAPLKLVAAAASYPVWRYTLAALIGSLPYYYALALLGRTFQFPSWVLIAAGVALLAGLAVDWVRHRRAA